ncbi:MAG: hypothetical protein AB1468_04210 [Candidatus Micrarchaeota archaeon]
MRIGLFFKTLILSVSAALIIYALTPHSLTFLLKLLALALGISLLTPLAYPYMRGVRKGDVVLLANYEATGFANLLQMNTAVAITNGRKGARIRVSLPNGDEAEGEIISYAGFITPARVRLVEREFNVSIV